MKWLKKILNKKKVLPEWYESLSDLPFLTFEKCFVHKDYRQLLKSGQFADEMAEQAVEKWFSIYSQFCEATGDKTAISFVRINTRIILLQATIERCAMLLEIVRQTRSKAVEKMLSKEFRGVPFDAKDEEAYQKALNLCGSRIKSLVFSLNELIAERDSMLPKEHKQVTEQYFTDILMEASHLEGYRIAKKDITAEEFCSYFKRLIAHRESLTKK